mmetsp:Transcript_19647/g.45778  ORF Transcript_19647/g.45778 Transcript_19647/m.45778 type:complete len:897 (+) Transcript_19647:54-2744(+)
MCTGNDSVEAAATVRSWTGFWAPADFEKTALRSDALAWSSEEVRSFVASAGREEPAEVARDTQDSPSPFTGAGAAGSSTEQRRPWWTSAQHHTEAPADDESIPRKLEGWWRVLEYHHNLDAFSRGSLREGELCFVEKLWSDRIRVFSPRETSVGIVSLDSALDLQLVQKAGSSVGSRWEVIQDMREGADDPDEIKVGQRRHILGGKFGEMSLKGMQCRVSSYIETMDRWQVELPLQDQRGKPISVAIVPCQLQEVRTAKEPKPNVPCGLKAALAASALELSWQLGTEESDEALDASGASGSFHLRLRFVSRVRPGGRVWQSAEDAMYKYLEMRYIGSGAYGHAFRVMRLAEGSVADTEGADEPPHQVLDVPRGSDRATVAKAFRRLAKKWHPDKLEEHERERGIEEFRRIHHAYEQLLLDPEKSSDLIVLKCQLTGNVNGSAAYSKVSVAQSFRTEARCLSVVSQLRLPNVSKLVEVHPNFDWIVTWPYLPEAIMPYTIDTGVKVVDQVDLVRQGWTDFARSRRCIEHILRTMMALIRHDVMTVDIQQNVIVDRESGEPLFIDFGRGETAGSIYKTRIKTFMKKVLSLLARAVLRASVDVAARFIREIEDTIFAELEQWQDEKAGNQKKALALLDQNSMKWQEGVEECRRIWADKDENPFRRIFGPRGVLTSDRALRPAKPLATAWDEDEDADEDSKDEVKKTDDAEGLCSADPDTLTPVQKLLRQQRKKKQRAALPKERPNVKIKVMETLPDGRLGLGLDDAHEDLRGVVITEVQKKVEKNGWQVGDRIVELNGKEIDNWDDFKNTWDLVKLNSFGALFGIIRAGVESAPEPTDDRPKCLNCGARGAHLQKCSTWAWMPEGAACVYFCGRDCQRQAFRKAKEESLTHPGYQGTTR